VEGERLGDKKSLERQIQEITGITAQALQGGTLSHFSVNERMSWAARRDTKREEDAAYSLLGIFDIHMLLIYGEGRKKALVQLQKQIKESHEDAFKRQEGTAFVSLLYLLILITQLMTLLGLCHSNEIPALPVVSPSLQSLEKRYLLEVKPQRWQL
jgi:hypothetical protein